MTRRHRNLREILPRRLLLRLLMILAFPLSLAAAETVTLGFRDSACVNDTVVTLGDITTAIDAATPELRQRLAVTTVGESAPAGFARFLTSDEAVVYALHPRFPGVTFKVAEHKRLHIATGFKEHILLEFAPEIVEAAYQGVPWKKDECTITLMNGEKTWRCLDKPFTVAAEAPQGVAHPKGNIGMKLLVTQGTKKYSVPVVVKVKVELPVLVAKTRINREEGLTESNCELKKTDITELKYQALSDIAALKTVRAARMIAPGTVIHEKLVKKIPVVQCGDKVFIRVYEGSVSVAVMGIARQDGATGDKIWVENATTHKLLHAQIKAPGTVCLLSTRGTL